MERKREREGRQPSINWLPSGIDDAANTQHSTLNTQHSTLNNRQSTGIDDAARTASEQTRNHLERLEGFSPAG